MSDSAQIWEELQTIQCIRTKKKKCISKSWNAIINNKNQFNKGKASSHFSYLYVLVI